MSEVARRIVHECNHIPIFFTMVAFYLLGKLCVLCGLYQVGRMSSHYRVFPILRLLVLLRLEEETTGTREQPLSRSFEFYQISNLPPSQRLLALVIFSFSLISHGYTRQTQLTGQPLSQQLLFHLQDHPSIGYAFESKLWLCCALRVLHAGLGVVGSSLPIT